MLIFVPQWYKKCSRLKFYWCIHVGLIVDLWSMLSVSFIRYVRLLGAMYMRLTGTAVDCYKYLEPLYNDYRKIKSQNRNGGEFWKSVLWWLICSTWQLKCYWAYSWMLVNTPSVWIDPAVQLITSTSPDFLNKCSDFKSCQVKTNFITLWNCVSDRFWLIVSLL